MTLELLALPPMDRLVELLRYDIMADTGKHGLGNGCCSAAYTSRAFNIEYTHGERSYYTIRWHRGLLRTNRTFMLFRYWDTNKHNYVSELRELKGDSLVFVSNTDLAALYNALFHHC